MRPTGEEALQKAVSRVLSPSRDEWERIYEEQQNVLEEYDNR